MKKFSEQYSGGVVDSTLPVEAIEYIEGLVDDGAGAAASRVQLDGAEANSGTFKSRAEAEASAVRLQDLSDAYHATQAGQLRTAVAERVGRYRSDRKKADSAPQAAAAEKYLRDTATDAAHLIESINRIPLDAAALMDRRRPDHWGRTEDLKGELCRFIAQLKSAADDIAAVKPKYGRSSAHLERALLADLTALIQEAAGYTTENIRSSAAEHAMELMWLCQIRHGVPSDVKEAKRAMRPYWMP